MMPDFSKLHPGLLRVEVRRPLSNGGERPHIIQCEQPQDEYGFVQYGGCNRCATTVRRAIRPVHVKTLLEQEGIPVPSNADAYCEAIQRYIAGEYGGNRGWSDMWADALKGSGARQYRKK